MFDRRASSVHNFVHHVQQFLDPKRTPAWNKTRGKVHRWVSSDFGRVDVAAVVREHQSLAAPSRASSIDRPEHSCRRR